MNMIQSKNPGLAKKVTLALCIGTTLILWASAFPAIRAGLAGYTPKHLVLLRLLTASLAFILIAPFVKIRLPRLEHFPFFCLA